VAASRKRGGAKRPVKKTQRARSRRLGTLALVVLAVMILGFLTRRVMLPSAVHYLAHRPPDSPATNTDGGTASGSGANQDGDSEHLTTGDRQQLDAIIKHKGN
jgi:hypothetical protein